MARFVIKNKDMVLGRSRTSTAIVVPVDLLVVDRQYGHGRGFRIGRKIGSHMQHCSQRNIPQVRWSPMKPDHAVRKHRKRVRIVPEEHARTLYADTAATVGMVDKDKFASIRMRHFQRRKLARCWAEDVSSLFLAEGGAVSDDLSKNRQRNHKQQRTNQQPPTRNDSHNSKTHQPRTKNYEPRTILHTSIALLLSPNLSVSTPIR